METAEKYLKAFIFKYGNTAYKKTMGSHDVGEVYDVCLQLGLGSFDSTITENLDKFFDYFKTRYPKGSDLVITEEIAKEVSDTVIIVKEKIHTILFENKMDVIN